MPNAPRATPSPPAPSHVAEVRDRARPERDVDVRVEREEPLALRLGVAAADGDHRLRVALASARARRRGARRSAVSGFSRIVQVLKTSTSASSCDARLAEPELLEHALDPLGVVGVHLAAERRDVVAAHGGRPSLASARARAGHPAWKPVRDLARLTVQLLVSTDRRRQACDVPGCDLRRRGRFQHVVLLPHEARRRAACGASSGGACSP